MKKEEFLDTDVSNCRVCGNKVRPKIDTVNDGHCTLSCPSIKCSYCKSEPRAFWPDEFTECIAAWEKR